MKNKTKTYSAILLILLLTINVISQIGLGSSIEKSDLSDILYQDKVISMKEKIISINPYFSILLKRNAKLLPDIPKKPDIPKEAIERKPYEEENKGEGETDNPDQEQTQYDVTIPISGLNWGAQSFQPTVKTLTSVELYIKRNEQATNGRLTVSIREDLTGEDKTKIDLENEKISTALSWVKFDFPDMHVEPDETYYIVVRPILASRRGEPGDCYYWGAGRNTNYNRGIAHGSRDGGRSWVDDRTRDFCFKTYGDGEINNPPIANPDFAETYQGVTVAIDVLANDIDPENDTISIVKVGRARNGTVEHTPPSPIVYYKPNENFTGSDTFDYLISDRNASEARKVPRESVGRVNITVKIAKVNAEDDTAVVDENSENNIINVLSNDLGVNIIITDLTNPEHGTASIVEDKISYTPNPNYAGSDSFTYTITSELQEKDTANVSITINNINDPPNQPDRPNGPTSGIEEIEYEFSFIASDPDNDDVYYKIDWDDGEISDWIGPYSPEEICENSHIFDDPGTYDIKVKAKDNYNAESTWSETLSIEIDDKNKAPAIPDSPEGPKSGRIGEEYTYTTSTTDIENDLVSYGWDWDGDDEVDEWTNYIKSGNEMSIDHIWSEAGTYNIKVKAEDKPGKQSNFSQVLVVTIVDNTAPEKPNAITGPTLGVTGANYKFSTSTSDIDGDKIEYMFDWGDGIKSIWIGSFDSEEMCEATHSFETPGVYSITVKARDEHGEESELSDVFLIEISEPELQLTIEKGFNIFGRVTAGVKNNGKADITNLSFALDVEYGIRGKTANDEKKDFTLKSNEEKTIEIEKLQRGIGPFGRITVVAKVSSDTITEQQVTAKGLIIGRLVFIKNKE